MTSNKPYFIRATYDWLVDNSVTPYILINAFSPGVNLPDACHIDDDHCVLLNISPDAVTDLKLGLTDIVFLASFNQTVHQVQFPVSAVKAIYCLDNDQGMYFDDEEMFDDVTVEPLEEKRESPFKLVKKKKNDTE